MTGSVSLVDIIHRCIEFGELKLPVFSATATRIQRELAKEEPDLRVIEQTITADQALSSEVLRIANSSFYRGLAVVSTVRAAVVRLGVGEIEKIVLLAATRQHFQSSDKAIALMMKKLWQHSVGCAYGAMWLAKRYKYGVDQSQAFFAGLFHDVGKLLILMVIELIKRKRKTIRITNPLLMEAMAKLHAREGEKLLRQWNMPEEFCLIARDHHASEIDEKNYMLLMVRMANLVCRKLGIGLEKDADLILPATYEANLLSLTEIDLAELEILLEDTKVLSA